MMSIPTPSALKSMLKVAMIWTMRATRGLASHTIVPEREVVALL